MQLKQDYPAPKNNTVDLFTAHTLPNNLKKEQILLVDDTLENLKLASDFLIEAGFEVLVAKSGEQALKKLEKVSPDLILLDVVMPEMDGFETCRNLKASPKTKDIPVIFMTAIADSSNLADKVKGLSLGAVDYISKPIQLEEVLARVRIHLHLRALNKQLAEQNALLQQEIRDREAAARHRQQAEEALRQSAATNRALLNAIPDMMFRCRVDGTFVNFKPAKDITTIVPSSVFIGKKVQEVLPPELAQRILHAYEQAIVSGEIQIVEYQLASDDQLHYYEARIVAKDSDEIISIVRDITDRKQAEEALRQSEAREREKANQLEHALEELKRTQTQLIQTEKMSSLGRMIAGIAHEINNPTSFICGNLTPAREYFHDLIRLLELYQQTYPNSTPEIQAWLEEIDFDFLREDWSKLMDSMDVGVERIQQIVLSLKSFSRLDESALKPVDIHEGIDNSLLILQHRLRAEGNRPEIQVIKDYGQLPQITCYASQLNQVFMNLLSNAIDALETQPSQRVITIRTQVVNGQTQQITNNKQQTTNNVVIRIADNGSGMSEEVLHRIFDPFFTTKPVGRGTGLGLSISYQIVVEKHGGQLSCVSTPGKGTEFMVKIPLCKQ